MLREERSGVVRRKEANWAVLFLEEPWKIN